MARGRMINTVISNSRKVNSISDQSALLFTWMQAHTDDLGRLEGEPYDLLFLVVPRRGWSVEQVETYVKEMFEIGLIKLYRVHDRKYIEIIGFDENQTLRKDRKRKGKCPYPTEYDSQWFTNDGQRLKIDSEVKLSRSRSQVEVSGSDTPNGKPMAVSGKPDGKPVTPKQKALMFFEGVHESIEKEGKYMVDWLKEMLAQISEKNKNIEKKIIWNEVKGFTGYWTELTHDGIKQRWQCQKTFEVDKRLVTWFKRAGVTGFQGAMGMKKKGKNIVGLNEDTQNE